MIHVTWMWCLLIILQPEYNFVPKILIWKYWSWHWTKYINSPKSDITFRIGFELKLLNSHKNWVLTRSLFCHFTTKLLLFVAEDEIMWHLWRMWPLLQWKRDSNVEAWQYIQGRSRFERFWQNRSARTSNDCPTITGYSFWYDTVLFVNIFALSSSKLSFRFGPLWVFRFAWDCCKRTSSFFLNFITTATNAPTRTKNSEPNVYPRP